MPGQHRQLVLLFTPSVSLVHWQDSGMLGREWAIYARLLERPDYRRLVVVSYGDASDRAVLDSVLRPDDHARVMLVCNDRRLSPEEFAASIPERVAAACELVPTIVKTNQMVANDLAVDVAAELRRAGLPTALIARGGYWWSHFVSHASGEHSAAARDAVARERRLCRAAHVVVGTTREMTDGLRDAHGLDAAAMRLIPNYVIVDSATSAVAREPGTVLYAGQLVKRKRVDVLIRCAAILAKKCRLFQRLDVVGAGPEAAALRTLATELNAPVRFEARLPHEELLRRMAGTSVYAQASELEGHPKTVIEAMATGAAVVVAPSPGLGCVVEGGLTGVVAEAEPEAFADAIRGLLENECERITMGERASAHALSHFGLSAVLKLELEAHDQALIRETQATTACAAV
jgi:glycosyltransferase involved in cell wall biosynthesis